MKWRRKQAEERLEKELLFHLDQHTQELIARGLAPEEARRQARIALGGPEQVKEQCREQRRTRWLEDLWQDFRYAQRTLRQRPGFTAAALCTLALGVGATTLMFSLVNGVLLKPLPFPEPDRLVTLQGRTETYGSQNVSYLEFLDWKRESRSLGRIGAWIYDGGTLSGVSEPTYVEVRHVSSDLFSVLGVHVAQGRAFRSDEDRPGATPVAVVSDNFWRSHLGGAASGIGTQVVVDHRPYTVIGVAPPGFGLGADDDIYLPLGQNTSSYMQNRRARPVRVVARLRPGVTLAQAQAEAALFGQRLAKQYPDSNAKVAFAMQRLLPDTGDAGNTLWLLFGAVCLVLLIACVNVASLLLARSVSRQRELAMRAALGAGRGRLIRQCLTESGVLGLSGGAIGVLLAILGIRPFIKFWPGSLPRGNEVQLDWRVLLFALTLSLGCGLLFGLAPALRAPARSLELALKAGGRTVAESSRHLHGGFVVSEIALAIILLISAGMLGRTLLHLSALNPGLNVQNLLTARMALSPATLENPAQTRGAWMDVLNRARGVAGVQSAAIVDTVPMREGNNQLAYWTSAEMPPPSQQPTGLATSVSPDYLQVMEIPLFSGRFFDDQDRLGHPLVVVIDDVMARRTFGGENPLGRELWIPAMGPAPVKIIGVAGHVRYWGLAGDDQAQVRAQFYYPFAQVPDPLVRRWSELMSIAVRTGVPPLNLVQPLRQALRGAGGDQVLYEIRTMEQLAGASLAPQRFLLLLFAIFAGLALLLACIGIYGVLAYLTNLRVPEIGLRMALGASAGAVIRLVLGQSLTLIFAGMAVGIVVAIGGGRLLQRFVEGMQPMDTVTVAMMTALLFLAASFASFLPARKASRIDPMLALRQD